MNKILVVAAHPDDEVLLCGGTIARMAAAGDEVYTLILGEGKTSRDEMRNPVECEAELSRLAREIREANFVLGVQDVFHGDFPDNRFDSVDLLDIIKRIEHFKHLVQPNIVFTHSKCDLNVDHCVTHTAVLTATRPMEGEPIQEIYCGEVLSSTEWNFPLSFSPNTFFRIADTMGVKVDAMSKYSSELRPYPHPRSLRAMEESARMWGVRTGLGCAEAFECLRRFVG